MNANDFKKAMFSEFKDPGHYESIVFEEWVNEINDQGANFDQIMKSIIKSYTYKTFPPYKTYAACFEGGGKADESTVSIMNRIETTKSWEPRQIYKKFVELFFKDMSELSNLQKEFIAYWSDFHSIICTMGDKKWEKDRIAELSAEVKNHVISGDTFEFMYKKYFGNEKVNNGFTKLMTDELRHGMSAVEKMF